MSPTWADFQPQAILQLLAARGVDHVIVGGYAAVLHGSPRITQDLDISYATDQANLDALGRALIDVSARLYGVDDDVPFVADGRTLARTELLTLQTDLGKLDLMTDPSGGPGYERLRADAETVDIGGLAVRIASLDDLISMKRSAGRPKDEGDVVELEAIARLRHHDG